MATEKIQDSFNEMSLSTERLEDVLKVAKESAAKNQNAKELQTIQDMLQKLQTSMLGFQGFDISKLNAKAVNDEKRNALVKNYSAQFNAMEALMSNMSQTLLGLNSVRSAYENKFGTYASLMNELQKSQQNVETNKLNLTEYSALQDQQSVEMATENFKAQLTVQLASFEALGAALYQLIAESMAKAFIPPPAAGNDEDEKGDPNGDNNDANNDDLPADSASAAEAAEAIADNQEVVEHGETTEEVLYTAEPEIHEVAADSEEVIYTAEPEITEPAPDAEAILYTAEEIVHELAATSEDLSFSPEPEILADAVEAGMGENSELSSALAAGIGELFEEEQQTFIPPPAGGAAPEQTSSGIPLGGVAFSSGGGGGAAAPEQTSSGVPLGGVAFGGGAAAPEHTAGAAPAGGAPMGSSAGGGAAAPEHTAGTAPAGGAPISGSAGAAAPESHAGNAESHSDSFENIELTPDNILSSPDIILTSVSEAPEQVAEVIAQTDTAALVDQILANPDMLINVLENAEDWFGGHMPDAIFQVYDMPTSVLDEKLDLGNNKALAKRIAEAKAKRKKNGETESQDKPVTAEEKPKKGTKKRTTKAESTDTESTDTAPNATDAPKSTRKRAAKDKDNADADAPKTSKKRPTKKNT